jgi:hypothetical protein
MADLRGISDMKSILRAPGDDMAAQMGMPGPDF